MAGVRQAENLRALFNNFGKTLNYVEEAYNSDGYAAKKYEVYLDSIEAKTNTLISTFQEIAYQPGFEQLYKLVLDIGTAFGELLKAVTSSKAAMFALLTMASTPLAKAFIGMGAGAVMNWNQFGASISAANKATKDFDKTILKVAKGSDKSKLAFQRFGQQVGNAINLMGDNSEQDKFIKNLTKKGYTQDQWNAILGNKALTENTREKIENAKATLVLNETTNKLEKQTFNFGNAFKGLWASISPMLLIAGITAAIGLVVWGMDELVLTTEEARKKIQDFSTDIETNTSELNSINEQLETTQKRIQELKNIGILTLTEESELNKLERQNNALLLQKQLREDNIALANKGIKKTVKEKLEGESVAPTNLTLKEQASGKGDTGISEFTEKSSWAEFDGYVKEYQTVVDEYNALVTELNNPKTTKKRAEEIDKELLKKEEKITKIQNKANELSNDIMDMIQPLADMTNDKEALKMYDELSDKLIQYNQNVGGAMGRTAQQIEDDYKNVVSNINKYLAELNSQYEGNDALDSFAQKITTINDEFIDGKSSVQEYFGKIQKELDSLDLSKLNTDEELQGMVSTVIGTLSEGLSSISSLWENGAISVNDYLLGLQSVSKATLDAYTKTNDLTKNSAGEWVDATGKVDEYANTLEIATNSLDDFSGFIDSLSANLSSITDEFTDVGDAIIDTTDMTEAQKTAFEKQSKELASYYKELRTTSPEVFNDIVSRVAKATYQTTEEVQNGLTDAEWLAENSGKNMEETLGATADVMNEKTKTVTQSLGDVFVALGNLIKDFDYSLSITPKNIEKGNFSLIKWIKGEDPGKLPSITWDITGKAGGSAQALGESISAMGTNMQNTDPTDITVGGIAVKGKKVSTDTGSTDGLVTKDKGSSSEKDVMEEYDSLKKTLEHIIKMSEFKQSSMETGTEGWQGEYDVQLDAYKKIQQYAHEQADKLRAKDAKKYAEQIAELQEDWWDAQSEIQQIEFDRIDKVYQYEKNKIQNLADILESKKDAMVLGTDEWSEANTKLLEYHNESANQTLEYIKELKALDPLKYSEQINEAEKEYLSLLKKQLGIKESIADAYASIPGIVDKIITKEKIEPLKKQKEILEGIKDLNTEIIGLERDKAQAMMGGEDELATQFQSQIDYINQQKIELNKITDLDEKKNKLAQINLTLGKMKIDQLKAELALIQGQKNQRVYHEDEGWQWESDKEAELNKQQQIVEAEADAEIDAIDSQIESWENYIDKFSEAVDDYTLGQETMTLNGLLGANARNKLLNGEMSVLDKFIAKYASAQQAVVAMQNAIVNMEEAFEMPSAGGGVNSYDIGTKAGATIANNLKAGETFKADDGSTWLKNQDGSLSVTTKSGNTYAGNITYGGSSSFSSSGSSSGSTGKTSGNYTIGSSAGKQIASSLSSGQSYSASDGSTWTKNKDGSITVTTKSGSTLAGVVTKHDGIESGLIGGLPLNPETEQLVKAAKGEGIFTESQMSNISSELMALRLMAMPQIASQNNGASDNSTSISINNMNVTCEDANDFLKQMKNLVIVTGKN